MRATTQIGLGLLLLLTLIFVGRWLNANKVGGQGFAEPFRIAGNFYYVGANDVASFLIAGPEGHVLIDGGYPVTAPMIVASIAKLGFDVRDVEVLLNSGTATRSASGRSPSPRTSRAGTRAAARPTRSPSATASGC